MDLTNIKKTDSIDNMKNDVSQWDFLKEVFHEYRMERMTKVELQFAIGLWQRANGYL